MKNRYFFQPYFLISLLFFSCVDPVEPEFEFKEGLVFIEGFASTAPGASFVIINKSETQFGVNTTVFETGATVTFRNSDTGETTGLIENGDAYVPPADFVVSVGQRWELDITLIDGTQYKSSPEIVLEPIPIAEAKATFSPELRFNQSLDRFEPGHSISVTLDDPENQENFYYWTYRSFENLTICKTCGESVFRDGECITSPAPTPDYFNYSCETDCWKIRFPENINIFSDEFSNGRVTSDLQVATIPLYNKEDIVVELQQFSLTPAAYDYYKVLKDIVDNSGGFNAPPPAALIGNLSNVNDAEDFVFGRFTAVATRTVSIFIDRTNIPAEVIEVALPLEFEPTIASPHPPPATTIAPCTETRFRTAIQPEGWIN